MPCRTPISRMLSRMSPLRMWLNSWAMTPCSSSRVSCSTQPRVTPTTASLGEKPAAKALMPCSSSSMNTGGTGTPEARAISSTTLSSRRSTGSVVFGIDPPAAEPLGHDRAAARKLGDLEQAAAADQRQRGHARQQPGTRRENLPCPSRRAEPRSPSRQTSCRRCAITANTNITTSHLVLRRAID